MTIALIAIAT